MHVLLRELSFLKKYWPRLIVVYACLIGSVGSSLVAPWLVKQTIDIGLASGRLSILITLGLMVIGAALFRGMFAYGQAYLAEYLSQRVAYDIRNAIYNRLQYLSYAYHDRQQTGQLMSRATADVEAVRALIQMGAIRMVQITFQFLLSCYLLLNLNWQLTLIVFSILPVVGVRAVVTSNRLRPVWVSAQEAVAQLGTILQENLSGIRVVKSFTREKFEGKKFGSKAEFVFQTNFSANRIQSFNSAIMTFMTLSCTAVVLWYGGRQVIAGNLTLGGLVQFNLYLAILAMPIRSLGWMANVFARAESSGERIFEILDTESEVKERVDAVSLPAVNGLVKFENVSFAYNSVSAVLKDVNLEVFPGQVVALMGATGSGKSTVVSLIPRFYDVTGGRITIDDIDIRDVTIDSLRKNVGIVHQDPFLFTATIRDNISYGAVDATEEDIIDASKVARIHDFVMSLPVGYDTWVGERGITLSGGQKQRVSIARTILMDPRVLILDDSTSSVDMETEYLIQLALAELMTGRTTFVIAQRLRTLLRADQILVLRSGQVVERGTHQELLDHGGIYREIYELQLKDQEEAAAAQQVKVG
ncbi:MAG: ABC transporter ATP-binding protein [Dehalococcoidia bacterium]|nr:ABC transporter ATP-binding protein [Dehalococcoidia bacterium]